MGTSSLSMKRDFGTLVRWLKTFPRMKGKGYDDESMGGLLQDEAFARDIFQTTCEVCGEPNNLDNNRNCDDSWTMIRDMLSTKMPDCEYRTKSTMPTTSSDRVALISMLLCYGVSDDCRQQRMNVQSILSLTSEDQKVLRAIIEEWKERKSNQLAAVRGPKNHEAVLGESLVVKSVLPTTISSSDEDTFVSPRGHDSSSQQERLFLPAVTRSSSTTDSYLDTMIKDLQERNERLRQEMENTHQREVALGHEIERSGDKLRKEMIKLDSTWLRRVEETRDDYDQEISHLKGDILKLRDANTKLEQREKDTVRAKTAELKAAQDRLAEAEAKLEWSTERLSELEDVKNALHREEEAHSLSVEECHRLRDELTTSKVMSREVEKLKSRVVEAESRLVAQERDLFESLRAAQEREDKCQKLTEELLDRTEEVDGLRRELDEKEPSRKCTDSETLVRLRHENMRLMDYLAEVEQQNQYELNASEEQIGTLQTQVTEMNCAIEEMKTELEERTNQLMGSQASLSQTCNQLRSSETKYETLRVDAKKWKQRADDAKVFTSRRKQLLSKLQTDLANAMDADKATIASLQLEVKEWKSMATKAEDMLEDCQNEHTETVDAMNKFASSLDQALHREEALQQEKERLEATIRGLRLDLGEERRLKGEVLVAKDKALKDTCRIMMVESSSGELNVCQQSSWMDLLAKEREVHETQFDLLKNKYQQHLGEIKQQMSESELKHNRYLDAIMEAAHEEREKVVKDYNSLLREIQSHDTGIEVQNVKGEYRYDLESNGLEIEILDGSTPSRTEQVASVQAQTSELAEESRPVDDKIKAEIASYKKKAEDASKMNETLLETVADMKKEHDDLQNDNDVLQKQLDEKLGDFKKVQGQFESLEAEFSALLNESRDLKKSNAKISSFQNCVVYALTGSTEALTPGTSTSSFVGRTPAHLRKEYELKVKSMVNEKRTLVKRSNSAAVDMQKALRQAWEADQQVASLKKELRSARLARRSLQIAIQSEGIELASDMSLSSSSMGSSNDSSNNDKRSFAIDVTCAAREPPPPSPRDVAIMMGNNDIEATPILTPSSSSSSMDIPPPPTQLLSGVVQEKIVSIDSSDGGDRQEAERDLPPPATSISSTSKSATPPALSTLVERLSLEDSGSVSTPKNSVGESPVNGRGSTILSPSSRHNRRVHWNDDKLWVASDGTTPTTPTTAPSPIADKYCAVMMSPMNEDETRRMGQD